MGKHENHAKGSGIVLGLVFSVGLAISLFSAGFFACTLQPTTAFLSRLFSDFETSAFLPDDTVSLAVATRDFTVEFHQDPDEAAEKLARQIVDAAHTASQAGSIKADRWKGIDVPQAGSAQESLYALAAKGAQYAFGRSEIDHLGDCNRLINAAIPPLAVVAAASLVLGIVLATKSNRRITGRALVAGPVVCLLGMIGIGLWAAIDFRSFFGAFHGLLFPQGNWTFPADSLLICMLPTSFWVGMLATWIAMTAGLCLISVLVGRHLLRR